MSRYRAIYQGGRLLAEYLDDVLIFVRSSDEGQQSSGPQIVRDIDPYKSMVTGEAITSRSQHREHLKRHDCIEIGNDTSHMNKRPEPGKNDRKRVLASLVSDMSDRQISKMIGEEIRRRRS